MALLGSGASSMVLFARHVTTAAHILALIVAILMIVWVVHYQGGANINSEDSNIVFNVHPLVMWLGFILMIGEEDWAKDDAHDASIFRISSRDFRNLCGI
ncbi:putative ascorbate-specific transmembrane electron transporter 1 [Carex littledalei]|uniref:Putative ascorbate-specific transmembrane electron transporter 1 n=1 Tax=Carex littledalei TaxID=544730 RepID=A0A833QL56_9POAL|nr:putative ascorbate-specific transmembrane electron transporter 1 [Carex littledalei]